MYIGNFAKEQGWKNWRDILKFVKGLGCKRLVKRMKLNNTCWNSSGEFGRSQIEICNNLLMCRTKEEAEAMAWGMDEAMAEDIICSV